MIFFTKKVYFNRTIIHMFSIDWLKIEDEIVERYTKKHSFKIQYKEYPNSLVVRHSKTAFIVEIILGLLMTILPFLFLILYPKNNSFFGVAIIALFGVLIVFSAKNKLKTNNYTISKRGIRYGKQTVVWSTVKEIQLVKLAKKRNTEVLRVLNQNGSIVFDLPFIAELDPKPHFIKEYLLFILKDKK